MGWLTASFMEVSISSREAIPASSILTAPKRKGVKSRVTMKPPTSGATTTVFPKVFPHDFTVSIVSPPVMIVSYKDREEDRQRGLEVGADYYITKGSFHDQTLLTAVSDLIGDA